MDESVPKSFADCVFKFNFLISQHTFSHVEGVSGHAKDQSEAKNGPAADATCEVISDDEENNENAQLPTSSRRSGEPQLRPPAKKTLKTCYDIKDIPNFLQQLVDDETIGWPKQAFIRFIQVINQTYDIVGTEQANFYIGLVASNMHLVSSDERFISECYIHPEDIKKLRKDIKSNPAETQYYRTNYEVDASLSKIKEVLIKFYDLSNFLSFNRDVKLGNYKINASDKAEVSGSRKSERARKSLQVLTFVEEE